MKKLKKYLIFIVFILSFSGLNAKNTDVIILMDSSGSILPWFEQINGSIISNITEKFIRKGDVFHLISFNSRVNLEIVQPIQTETDISRIVSRLMLLYPLGNNSDFLSGIQYAIQYGSTLNQNNDTILIIISDGIFNPPNSSPFAKLNAQEIEKEISQFSHKIRSFGWKSFYIKLPYPDNSLIYPLEDLIDNFNKKVEADFNQTNTTNETSNLKQELASNSTKNLNQPSLQDEQLDIKHENINTNRDNSKEKHNSSVIDISKSITDSLKIEYNSFNPEEESINFIENVLSLPEITFPKNIGKVSKNFIIPFKIKNTGNNKLNLELKEIKFGNLQILSKKSFITLDPQKHGTLNAQVVLPHSIQKGKNILELELVFSDDVRAIPQRGFVEINLKSFSLKDFNLFNASYFFAILFVIVFVIIIIILILFILNKASTSVTTVVKRTQDDIIAEDNNSLIQATTIRNNKITLAQGKSETLAQGKSETFAQGKSETFAQGKSKTLDSKPENSLYISPINQKVERSKKNLFEFKRNSKEKIINDNAKIVKEAQSSYDKQSAERIATTNINMNQLLQIQKQEKQIKRSLLNSASKKKIQPRTTKIQAANSNESIPINIHNSITLQLFVKNQNTNIGKRNVKIVKAGNRLSIGGKGSALYIFLVKFPKKIAELRWNGNTLDLALLKPEYFPYAESNIIEDCLDKDILAVSNKNYEITFKIIEYVDPLHKLNSILKSIMTLD